MYFLPKTTAKYQNKINYDIQGNVQHKTGVH